MSVDGYCNKTGEIEIIISSYDRSKHIKTFTVECEPGEAIQIEDNLLDSKPILEAEEGNEMI